MEFGLLGFGQANGNGRIVFLGVWCFIYYFFFPGDFLVLALLKVS